MRIILEKYDLSLEESSELNLMYVHFLALHFPAEKVSKIAESFDYDVKELIELR